MQYEKLLSNTAKLDLAINQWMNEDIPSFDIGGIVVGSKKGQATLLGKSDGILAGVPFFTRIFEKLNCQVDWILDEGSQINPVIEVAKVKGEISNILAGERLSLNLLSHVSGIATQAKKMTLIATDAGFKGKIAGTRKTLPGLRLMEKYGLIVGGADTHRMDLSSMVMLKDNHITGTGSISNAVKKARSVASVWTNIEVECNSVEQAMEAFNAGADIVMLDNMTPSEIELASEQIKTKYPHKVLEVSGGITEQNIQKYFLPHVDIISMGSLTSHVRPVDLSLKIQ